MTTPLATEEEEYELVRQYILFGILFQAVMVDWSRLQLVPLKLSYQAMIDGAFQELSRWAERQQQQMRRLLQQRGCTVVRARREGHVYMVHYQQRGYVREARYTIEMLQAECQQLIDWWMRNQQRGEKRA
ncbi:hypothetical protein [Brevibacillus parabrevis]|uniref:hypothetical protein n=1 Tax=Brevibacillus parabrevis TaxID=54914 RepID=UPI0028D478D7|nr:hypothetical protein [Brevibacillus parabrevis]MED1721841.1 hypothetical protein [Brevibacillus parabrevis]